MERHWRSPHAARLLFGTLTDGLHPGGTFNETYQFEIVKADAIDNPRVSDKMILQQAHKYAVDFELTAPKDLLSKVGQAEPGTPLTLIGWFRQYNRTLILQEVETISTREQ
jgi:hypothetical protein